MTYSLVCGWMGDVEIRTPETHIAYEVMLLVLALVFARASRVSAASDATRAR